MIFRQGIVLKVKNLNVDLGKERILENLSFEVKEGEVLTILGPNGAGKTVLLKTLLGILPYKGKIEWMPKIRIGYVPQRLPFIKDIPLSVEEFFELKNVSEKENWRFIFGSISENFGWLGLGFKSSGFAF